MTTATISYSRIKKNVESKISSVSLPSINWKAICVVCFFACFSLLVFYVWQINYLTKGSYLINNYQTQINKLSNEKKNLELNFAKVSFLGQVQEKVNSLSFQKATSIKYIQILENSFASARK
jgi:predicted PurR-regulated permease PerM